MQVLARYMASSAVLGSSAIQRSCHKHQFTVAVRPATVMSLTYWRGCGQARIAAIVWYQHGLQADGLRGKNVARMQASAQPAHALSDGRR